jgi:hypothetical protein
MPDHACAYGMPCNTTVNTHRDLSTTNNLHQNVYLILMEGSTVAGSSYVGTELSFNNRDYARWLSGI